MTEELKIKEIVEFWLGFEFLKKFRSIGDDYIKELKQEEDENGFEQIKGTVSSRGY